MEIFGDTDQEKTNSETQRDGKRLLNPFVCGLCDCSYGQFVSFYKHFKKHKNEVGQDSFHICEDLASSERDVCEDRSSSIEMQTFNCGICPASFIKVCILHAHMEKHESKGSYTLDIQSKTGYPSPKQYPYVSIGNSSPRTTSDDASAATGNKAKRVSPSGQGHPAVPGITINLSKSEVGKRTRPSNYVQSSETEVRTRRGMLSKDVSAQKEDGVTDWKTKNLRGRRRGPDASKTSSETTRPGWKKLVLIKSGEIPEYVEENQLERTKISKKSKKKQRVSIKSEPFDTLSKTSPRKLSAKTKDNGKVDQTKGDCKEFKNAGDDNNETEKYGGMDDYDDSDNGVDLEDFYNDDNDEIEEEEDISSEQVEDKKSACACDRVESKKFDNKAESLKTETEVAVGEESRKTVGAAESLTIGTGKDCDTVEMEEDATYNFRRKRTLPTQEKAPLKKKFLFCEVCGMKREKYVLVKHVEETHGGVELSKEFQETLKKLKSLKQNKENGKTKYVKKVNDEAEDDADYEPVDKPLKAKRVRRIVVKYHGSKKSFAKCKLCCMIIPLPRLKGHEHSHRTKPDKFRPENLKKCDVCNRVLFKMVFDTHKCSVIMNKKEKMKKEEEEDSLEKKPKNNMTLTPCHMCGILIHRYKLKSHLRSHSDARPYACTKCSSAFKLPQQLKSHDRNVHGERSFQCDQCILAFTNISTLKEHYMLHTDEKPFSCTICGKQFRRNSALQIHMGRHDAVGKFVCKECGRIFKAKNGLKAHLHDVHRNIRNWICSWPQCGKLFQAGPTLRRHMLVHTGERPHKCTHCDQAFSQRPELKTHLMKKHNTDKMPPPTHVNPYSGISPSVIKCPAGEEDPDNVRTYKTLMFTSAAMSNVDVKILQNQLAQQMKKSKPRERKSGISGQKAETSARNSLNAGGQSLFSRSNVNSEPGISDRNNSKQQVCMDVDDIQATKNEPVLYSDQSKPGTNIEKTTVFLDASSLPLLSNTRPEVGSSHTSSQVLQGTGSFPLFSNTGHEIRAGVFITPVMPGTNSLSMYRNTTNELRTNNTNNGAMQVASSPVYNKTKTDTTTSAMQGTSSMPMVSNTTPELGTTRAGALMQGSSTLSMPLDFDGVKSELGPSTMNVQGSLMSADSVLTTMAAAAISQPANNFVYEPL